MRSAKDHSSDHPSPGDPAEQASVWLARRDRGLTAAEQDAYLQWLQEDVRHGAAIQRLEGAWGALDQLAEWRPAHSAQPNPDLLAVPRRRSWRYWVAGVAAAFSAIGSKLTTFRRRNRSMARCRAEVKSSARGVCTTSRSRARKTRA